LRAEDRTKLREQQAMFDAYMKRRFPDFSSVVDLPGF
jgi:hypothetical protein